VIVVRAHEPLMLADYQRILAGTAVKLHNVWSRRNSTPSPGSPGEGGGGGSQRRQIETPLPNPPPEYRGRE
jgi:hypothetical protein